MIVHFYFSLDVIVLFARGWNFLDCQWLRRKGRSSRLIWKTPRWNPWSCACQEISIWNPLTLTVSASSQTRKMVMAHVTHASHTHHTQQSLCINNLGLQRHQTLNFYPLLRKGIILPPHKTHISTWEINILILRSFDSFTLFHCLYFLCNYLHMEKWTAVRTTWCPVIKNTKKMS